MALRNLRVFAGIRAQGEVTRTGTNSGEVTLGSDFRHGSASYDDETIRIFSVSISGITDSNNPIINLLTGAVTADGTTVTDSGVDHEGNALVTATAVYAYLIEADEGNPDGLVITTGISNFRLGPGQSVMFESTSYIQDPSNLTLSSLAGSASARITVLNGNP